MEIRDFPHRVARQQICANLWVNVDIIPQHPALQGLASPYYSRSPLDQTCLMALNLTAPNITLPKWIPSGFQVSSGNARCPTAGTVLTRFGIYNAISVGIYFIFCSYHLRRCILFWTNPKIPHWTFWSGLSSVALQVLGIVATSLLTRQSGYRIDLWQLIQLWAIRPRASWLIGNMVNVKRTYGFMSGALDNLMVEVCICSLGTVFVGRLAFQALSHPPQVRTTWYQVACGASITMLITTAFEVIWALWVWKRLVQTRGNAEAQDIDSLKWIARFMVPVTCICSYLIWAAFLYSSDGAYCPGDIRYVDLTWGLVPLVTNLMRWLLAQFQ